MPTNQQKKAKLRRKCDKLYQVVGRLIYDKCLICNNPISCLHHYYPKSTCSALRYDIENGIPLCVGHHFAHHCGDPEVHNRIYEIKGEAWLKGLRHKKKNTFVKTSLKYYQNIMINLNKLK